MEKWEKWYLAVSQIAHSEIIESGIFTFTTTSISDNYTTSMISSE